jgi:lipopolysaccharide/colanic/teichoic acid biosynthesis glycosyltransferase
MRDDREFISSPEKIPVVEKKPFYNFIKRTFDIVGSLLFIVLFCWLFAIAAIAIKLDDGGPVMYISDRVGKGGRYFHFYKFRSMKVGADAIKDDFIHLNETNGGIFKIKDDPRITRVGKFLRRTSIDELPQIINILKGDMSFVGPRPPLPEEVEKYREEAYVKLSVIGGLTCYWQTGGRSNLDFKEMIRLDRKYIRERGVWTDIKLLFRTIPAVFKGDGAY